MTQMVNPNLIFIKKYTFEVKHVDKSDVKCWETINDDLNPKHLSIAPLNTHSLGPQEKAAIFPSLKHESLQFGVTNLKTKV